MVPEGWKLCPLGALVSFTNGKAHEKDISEDGKYILVNSKFISTEGRNYKRSHEAFCPARSHDVLMVMSDVPNGRAIAKCFYVLEDGKYTVNQRIARLRAVKVDSKFLFYAINRNNYYLRFDDGITQTNLRKDEVLECPVRTPPLPEQKKIAQILSTWDQAITATERLLENSQQRKKGLMQQLLTGKKRLPGFEGEWSYQEIGKFLIESRIQSDSNDPSKRLTVRLNLKGIEQREVRGTEAKGSTAHYVRFAGQFIYGKQNIHKAAFGLIPEKFDKFETSQDLPAFDFKEGVDSHWFLYFCSQEWFYTDLEKKMTGTGSKRLNPKAFLKVKLPTPSFDEQRAIAEVLDLASRDIDAIQAKLELLQNEKKALMQQLLTGKRRVQVDTEAA